MSLQQLFMSLPFINLPNVSGTHYIPYQEVVILCCISLLSIVQSSTSSTKPNKYTAWKDWVERFKRCQCPFLASWSIQSLFSLVLFIGAVCKSNCCITLFLSGLFLFCVDGPAGNWSSGHQLNNAKHQAEHRILVKFQCTYLLIIYEYFRRLINSGLKFFLGFIYLYIYM